MIQNPDPGGITMGDLYEVIEEIGKGGYGNVYKVREKSSGQIYALKKVKTFDVRQATPPSFFREAECLRSLCDCNNILSLHSIFRCHKDNCFYLVLELCNCDLSEMIQNKYFSNNFPLFNSPISFPKYINEDNIIYEQIRDYMRQILLGIFTLHSKGFVHRDIKPSNILLKFDKLGDNFYFGSIKVADFGLSRNLMKLKNTRSSRKLTPRVTTLSYRAPELLLGSTNYDQSIDVWSLGCLFFEMITGKVLFHAGLNESNHHKIPHQLNEAAFSEFAQLNAILEICGTPSNEIWTDIPNAYLVSAMPKHESILSELLDSELPSPFHPMKDLLMLMLQLNPKKRITVFDALHHSFLAAPSYSLSSPILKTLNQTDQQNQEQKLLTCLLSNFSSSSPSEGDQTFSNSSSLSLSIRNGKNSSSLLTILEKKLIVQNAKHDVHAPTLSNNKKLTLDLLRPDKITPPEIDLF
ncbi:hypothetical protein M9Y10_035318 [Tritrichomonas musculus]|uniref:Protein kinase domain-containing protein n=1 Tax=Tritrichomonas musculus TaxID=1915356 RepID=A0ABR2KIE7_9EUKA